MSKSYNQNIKKKIQEWARLGDLHLLVQIAAWVTAAVGIAVLVFVFAATKQLYGYWKQSDWCREKTIDALLNVGVCIVGILVFVTGLHTILG